MKKSLIFALMLMTSLGFSQREKTVIDPLLKPYVIGYLYDGIKRGVDLTPRMVKNLDTITIDYKVRFPLLGYYSSTNRSIHIGAFNFIDTVIVRAVVYHELTHGVLNVRGHTCYNCVDIMSATSPKTFSMYANEEIWERELDELFGLIKEFINREND